MAQLWFTMCAKFSSLILKTKMCFVFFLNTITLILGHTCIQVGIQCIQKLCFFLAFKHNKYEKIDLAIG